MNRPAKGVICVPSAEHYWVVKEDVKPSHIYIYVTKFDCTLYACRKLGVWRQTNINICPDLGSLSTILKGSKQKYLGRVGWSALDTGWGGGIWGGGLGLGHARGAWRAGLSYSGALASWQLYSLMNLRSDVSHAFFLTNDLESS